MSPGLLVYVVSLSLSYHKSIFVYQVDISALYKYGKDVD